MQDSRPGRRRAECLQQWAADCCYPRTYSKQWYVVRCLVILRSLPDYRESWPVFPASPVSSYLPCRRAPITAPSTRSNADPLRTPTSETSSS